MATLFSRIFGRKKPQSLEEERDHPLDVSVFRSHLENAPSSLVQLKPPSPLDERAGVSGAAVEGLEDIGPTTAMQEVLRKYPAAQRALFRKYHVGGCSSCGFQPSDTLEMVCKAHNLAVPEVISEIRRSQEEEDGMQIESTVVAEKLTRGEIKLLDVRTPYEYEIAHIEGAILLDQSLIQEIIQNWPRETPIVTHCHHGIRSLDAAAYLAGHGFTNVKSMTGGIDAWSAQVDPAVPRY